MAAWAWAASFLFPQEAGGGFPRPTPFVRSLRRFLSWAPPPSGPSAAPFLSSSSPTASHRPGPLPPACLLAPAAALTRSAHAAAATAPCSCLARLGPLRCRRLLARLSACLRGRQLAGGPWGGAAAPRRQASLRPSSSSAPHGPTAASHPPALNPAENDASCCQQ